MPDPSHEDHWKYTLESLITNMELLEEHLKGFECNECETKHLFLISGFADEGIGMTDDERTRELLHKIVEWAQRAREMILKGQKPDVSELRYLRRQLQNIYLTASTGNAMSQVMQQAIDYNLVMKYEGKSLYDPEVQDLVKRLYAYESSKYGVPMPKVVFKENREFCQGTSCTITDSHGKFSQIWLKPDMFSVRTALHEWYHHMATVLGPEGVKKYFPDLKGDADSEDEANIFAEREAMALQSQTINSPATTSTPMQEATVLKQMGSDVFRGISDIYGWAEGILKVPRTDLNLEYTPEFIGRLFEVGYDYVFTPVGQAVANLVTALALMGVGTLNQVGPYDRDFLNEWAAHHLFATLMLASPQEMKVATAQARSMGAMMSQGRVVEALSQMVSPDIFYSLKNIMSSIQGFVQPSAPSEPSMAATQGFSQATTGLRHPFM